MNESNISHEKQYNKEEISQLASEGESVANIGNKSEEIPVTGTGNEPLRCTGIMEENTCKSRDTTRGKEDNDEDGTPRKMDYPVEGVPWDGVTLGTPTQTSMDCEDMESVASVSQPVLGKRKKPVSDGGGDESSEKEMTMPRRSKSHRTQCISSDEEEPSRRVTRANGKKGEPMVIPRPGVPGPSWVGSKIFGDSDTNTQSCLESESARNKRHYIRDKVTGKFVAKTTKKRLPGEPTIEEMLRPLPDQLDELEAAPTAQAIAFAVEWLEDIDLIRGRSSYQGVMSKRMRDRVAALKKVLRVLAVKAEEKGDLAYHKRKNAELRAQLLASQREMTVMRRRIDGLQNTVEELRKIIISGGDLRRQSHVSYGDCARTEGREIRG